MHPLILLECCIYFFWECILVNLGSYIILAMLLVIKCKRPHSKISHHFPTVLTCLSACPLRKTVKYKISGNFLLTLSQNSGCHFQVSWDFDMKWFLKHYLEHCQIKKYPRIQYHTLLAKGNASFGKKYQIYIIPNGIWGVLQIPKHDIPFWIFKISGEPFDVFEWGFLRPVSNSDNKIRPCRGHQTLTLGSRGGH